MSKIEKTETTNNDTSSTNLYLLEYYLDPSQDNYYLPFNASPSELQPLELYDGKQPVSPEVKKPQQSENKHPEEKTETSKQSDNPKGTSEGPQTTTNDQGTKITIFPDGTVQYEYTDEIAAQTGVKKDSLQKNGVHITEYTSGQKVTSYPDNYPDKKLADVTVTQTPDNSIVTRYPDNYPDKKLAGTTVLQNPDKSLVTRYPDHREETVFPDKKTELKLPNGTKITELPDGTKIYGSWNDPKYPTITVHTDKSVTCKFCDGAEFKGKLSQSSNGDMTITSNTNNPKDGTYTDFKITRKADGSVLTTMTEDGKTTSFILYPNGAKYARDKDSRGFRSYDDGKGNGYVIYPDDSVVKRLDMKTQNNDTTFTLNFKDGKTEIYKPDGSVQYLDANGNLEKEEHLEGTLADGSPVAISIVNGTITGKLKDGTIVTLKHPNPRDDDEEELPSNQLLATDTNDKKVGIVTLNEWSAGHLEELQDIWLTIHFFTPPTDLTSIDKEELPV